jgi:hypothetical protein
MIKAENTTLYPRFTNATFIFSIKETAAAAAAAATATATAPATATATATATTTTTTHSKFKHKEINKSDTTVGECHILTNNVKQSFDDITSISQQIIWKHLCGI